MRLANALVPTRSNLSTPIYYARITLRSKLTQDMGTSPNEFLLLSQRAENLHDNILIVSASELFAHVTFSFLFLTHIS